MVKSVKTGKFPWSIKGVSVEARDFVRTAAAERGITMGEWLTNVIQDETNAFESISDTQQNLLTADLGRSGDSRFYRGTAPFRIKLGYAPGVIIRFNGNNVELAPYTRNNIAVFNLRRRVDSAE